jgi:tRNA nucleotidyltransferase/poly(A) polymerase
MPQSNAQRDFALDLVKKLRAAGCEALWAGGCVRDQLLGLEPKDYDVATSAKPDEIRDLFGWRRTIAVGAAFGVITVLGPRAAGQIEVATFRSDAAYSDGRHPDHVTFTNAREDALRRDFTINGLFYDPVTEEVVDYVDGRADLERKLIRAIGDPGLRIREDRLRMLRAVRFAATFGFTIEPATLAAVQQSAAEVITVSPERIGMEIRRMLVDANRGSSLALLRESRLLEHVLPEIAALAPADWEETVRILKALNDPSLPLALAALLFRVSPTTDWSHQRPVGDQNASPPALVAHVARRLRYTNKECERAAWLLANGPAIARATEISWPQLQRLLVHDGAAELLQLHEAIAGAQNAALAFCRERLAWPAERLNPPPLVDGADLIAHGLTPGPEFSRWLEAARDAQLDGQIGSHKEALALIDQLALEDRDSN